ncbi:MAG: SDR family NAD(P)-dependent oxidoreductase [Alphaproteobacteria bacterium]|jgi:NAD(P)-dependent dehydrogenase (short-subunit alcohol dehydrogenase family)|nr:SDR family NAD(P)-dependent oxidoreductase [Alphaproteobacteria bacterium]
MAEGRTALVTGAARGIGRAIATRLVQRGDRVALMDLAPDVAATANAIGAAVAVQADVSDADAVAEAVRKIGDVEILVNNAGLVKNIAPVGRMTSEAWETELAVNLGGPFNLIRAVIGPMVEAGWGRIVNISSVAARGGLHYQAGYGASKAGLLSLTHTVTLEYARHGITCNAVLPGVIETENVKAMPSAIRDSVIASAPARRLGKVEEVAHLVAFLASDEAGYISGAEIDIDGGTRLSAITLGSRSELKERAEALARALQEDEP